MIRYIRTALCGALLTFGASSMAQVTWDLPTGFPLRNFHTQNLTEFVKDVKEATDGQLSITLHPNASLYRYVEIKRAVQVGQVQIGEFGPFVHSNEWDVYELDNLPFLASSYDEAMTLYQASKPVINEKLESQGMIALYSVAWPPQGLYSKKPINSVSDLKGMKWRAYSPTTARVAELVDAQPVSVQTPELSQAMATGVVEAFITSSQTGLDASAHEYLKYYYDLQAWLPRNVVVVNKRAFDALEPSLQDALLAAAEKAEARGWEMSQQANQQSMDTLREHGVEVVLDADNLAAEFQEIGAVLLEEWLAKASPEGQTIVNDYQNSR